ncbi:hypothetical protein AWRIB429_0788 [Oenococcus oeni AWRIB429]|uniref:Uncharacterized protein n=1 Tax=Oenococcus oeni AWRIB429 TaxID=655225 RepID=D3L8V8_OENOE|nr:hypothetical protein AWRIB429_0788 [Oenococcus oeni AWRIB429]KZD13319.1 hypothetical protein AC229_1921 [Oenococcus oeni]
MFTKSINETANLLEVNKRINAQEYKKTTNNDVLKTIPKFG